MLRLFVKQCLLFQSSEFYNIILGIFGWVSLSLLVYSVYELIKAG